MSVVDDDSMTALNRDILNKMQDVTMDGRKIN